MNKYIKAESAHVSIEVGQPSTAQLSGSTDVALTAMSAYQNTY